jgi:hypothetical protein
MDCRHLPHNPIIHKVVVVAQYVANAYNLAPRNARISVLYFVWYMSRGLGNDLNASLGRSQEMEAALNAEKSAGPIVSTAPSMARKISFNRNLSDRCIVKYFDSRMNDSILEIGMQRIARCEIDRATQNLPQKVA